MRKTLLLGSVAGALALSALAVASPQLAQEAVVKLANGKPRVSTGVTADLVETDPGATPAGNLPAPVRLVIRLPAGTKTNTAAAPQCNLSETDVRNGACPSRSVIGGGSGVANVVFGPEGPVVEDVKATVTIYNRRGAIAFRFVSEATGSLPSVTIVVFARVSKRGVLTADVPVLHPIGAESKVVLTELHVAIRKRSRTQGRRKRILVLSANCSDGSWETRSEFDYDDGSHREVTTTQPCRRPVRAR